VTILLGLPSVIPPGVTGYTTGRPAVREVLAYWPALLAKDAATPAVGSAG
jgi:hypothetical protein